MTQATIDDLQQMMNDLGWPRTCSVNDCINRAEVRQSFLTFLYNKFFEVNEENVPNEYLNEWFSCLVYSVFVQTQRYEIHQCIYNPYYGELSFDKCVNFLHRLVSIVIDHIQMHNNNYDVLIKKNNEMLRDIEMDYKNMLLPNELDYFPIDVKLSLKRLNKNTCEEDLKKTLITIKEDIKELEKEIKIEFESYYNTESIEELGKELNKLLKEMNCYMLKYDSIYNEKFNNNVYKMMKLNNNNNNNNNNSKIGDAVYRTVEGSNGITTIISDMNEINTNLEVINKMDLDEFVRNKIVSEDVVEMNNRVIEILENSKKL